MGKPNIPPVPPGLSREARQERVRFDKRRKAVLQKIKTVSLSILVWGPGITPPPKRKSAKKKRNRLSARDQRKEQVAKKREDIRQTLIELGHNAMFSEEFTDADKGLSESSKELAQALAVHLIIILLEEAPSATGELHEFFQHRDLFSKLYVLLPQRLSRTYTAQGPLRLIEELHNGVYWYKDNEVPNCNVLTKAVRRAEALREHIASARVGARMPL